MSYDYNAILQSIHSHRQRAYAEETDLEALSAAVEEFSSLASYCSLTPALWLLYAKDTAELMAGLMSMEEDGDDDHKMDDSNIDKMNEDELVQKSEMSAQTLATAIREFPGCAKLRYYYLFHKVVVSLSKIKAGESLQIDESLGEQFEDAILWVGSGSHPQSEHAANIWRLWVEYSILFNGLISTNGLNCNDVRKNAEISTSCIIVRRACLPLDCNSGLKGEIEALQDGQSVLPEGERHTLQYFFGKKKLPELSVSMVYLRPEYLYQLPKEERGDEIMQMALLDAVELGRRAACKSPIRSTVISQHEVAIQAFMYSDKIIDITDVEGGSMPDREEDSEHMPLMGVASEATSTAFIAYAQEFQKQKHCQTMPSMTILIYERALSECITHEGLWVSYILHLLREKKYEQAISICRRSCRNCPYSTRLFALNMQSVHIATAYSNKEFDSNLILDIAKAAFDLRFFPGDKDDYLEIYLEYVRTIRRELLRVAFAGSNDENALNNVGFFKYSPAFEEKIYNLVSDLRQAYDHVDTFVKQNYKNWNHGRSRIFSDRAYCEAFLIPFIYFEASTNKDRDRYFKAAINIDPANGQVWSDYVKHMYMNSCYFENCKSISLSPLILRAFINKTRDCFHKGLSSLSKARNVRDIERLSNDFLNFERMHGTADECMNAVKFVRGRIKGLGLMLNSSLITATVCQKPQAFHEGSMGNKRKIDDDDDENIVHNSGGEHECKRSKSNKVQTEKKLSLKVEKEKGVHPYTVKITNLSKETQDFDLVELLRERCGNIVHARIIREKGKRHFGESKGEAFVQFEEKISVKHALELSDNIGIHERLIKIEQSFHPAVQIVPPGRHKVVEKGKGKNSKYNERRSLIQEDVNSNKEATITNDKAKDFPEDTNQTILDETSKQSKPVKNNMLLLKPRSIGSRKRKSKLDI